MTAKQTDSKGKGLRESIAPLENVSRCASALDRAISRPAHLPGMAAFYGPSGWGKTIAASYTANKYRAYYVEAKSSWTRKALLSVILFEMGVVPGKTLYDMTDQVSEQLVLSGRPLIIDEFDHLVQAGTVEVVRDIHEGSGASILLIGEEQLSAKLKRWERFHSRVLSWVPAQPVTMDDAKHLRRLYVSGTEIRDDLLARLHKLANGAVRRICVNLDLIQQEALKHAWKSVGLKEWGERDLYTGDAPIRGR
jgi:DNA transposition AAA+ family ATPase